MDAAPRPSGSSEHAPESAIDISLVIPAWNEARLLPRLLDTVDLARAAYRHGRDRVEVIVADNDSTDETASVALARGCRVAHVSKRCIAAARNGGATIAQGTAVAFCDADFRIHPQTFNYIDSILDRPDFVGGATGITMERWSWGIRVTWCLILPPLWLFGLDGGVWFCRRDDHLAVGGFDESHRFGEDIRFLRALARLGRGRRPRQRLATGFTARRLGLAPAPVTNSARKWDAHGEWHMITDILTVLPKAVCDRAAVDRLVERYWYADRPEREDQ